jgi:outer membrane protein TolC
MTIRVPPQPAQEREPSRRRPPCTAGWWLFHTSLKLVCSTQDQQLQDLIHTALRQNYNVWIAAARILQAQAQVGIIRADGLPTISAGAQSVDQRNARTKVSGLLVEMFPAVTRSHGQYLLSLPPNRSYEILVSYCVGIRLSFRNEGSS